MAHSTNLITIVTVLLLYLCLAACSGKTNTGSGTVADTLGTQEITLHEALLAEDPNIKRDPHYLQQHLPILASIVKENDPIYVSLNNYVYDVLNNEETVKSENDLKRLFYKRDAQIMPTLHGDFFDPLAMKNDDFFVGDAGRKLQAELQSIGLQCIYAEGMYVDLGAAEMLPQAMKKFGSEVFRLYAEFLNAYGKAVGGEYPYLDLSGEMRMVAIGEAMLDKHPDHEYTLAIRSDFEFALHTLTDIHTVTGQLDTQEMFYALSTDPYPYMTSFEQHRQFVADYPNTKYGKIVQKILANPSSIAHAGNGFKDLFLVLVQWRGTNSDGETAYCDDAEAAKDSLYLHRGIDVAHVLPITQNGEIRCAIVYRFYPDKAQAEKAIKTLQIQIQLPLSIIKASFNSDSETWETSN